MFNQECKEKVTFISSRFVYKNKKLGNEKLCRKFQRKLLKAIHKLRDIKHEQVSDGTD